MKDPQDLEGANKLSLYDIEQALVEFFEELDLDQLTQLRLHGGHVWFTWRDVQPEDLVLNLHLGDPHDRAHTEWLEWDDVHIPIEADQVIEYNEDGEPDLDPVVTEEHRECLIAASEGDAQGALNDIEYKISAAA